MVGGTDEDCLITPDCGLAGVAVVGCGAGFGAAAGWGGEAGRAEGGVAAVAAAVAACCLSNSRGSEVIKACSSGEATTFRAT